MPADDVVAELDDWLAREATTLKHYPADDVDTELLERARDEIVALREMRDAHIRILSASLDDKAATRDAALEEAAQVCIGLVRGFPQCGIAASAIRKLKDKG